MAPWKAHRGCTGPGAQQAGYILHIWPGESRMGKTERPGKRRYGEQEEKGCNLFHKEAPGRDWSRATFPVSSPHFMLLSFANRPPMARKALTAAAVWRPKSTQCTCVCVCAVLEPASGRPRPRICCGSVQWTGARQDVTSWRKLTGHHRAKRLSFNVLCPAHLADRLKRTVRINFSPSFLGQYQLWTQTQEFLV